jgi:hypothetical protein
MPMVHLEDLLIRADVAGIGLHQNVRAAVGLDIGGSVSSLVYCSIYIGVWLSCMFTSWLKSREGQYASQGNSSFIELLSQELGVHEAAD